MLVQDGNSEGQRGFQAGDTKGGALELDFLLVEGVRRVVGGDGVDGAVENAFDQGLRDRRPSAAADSSCSWC